MSVIDVSEVKARLNKSLSVDDGELQDMLDAAEAEYAEHVGPIGTTTAPYYGGLAPKNATDVTVTDADGNSLELSYYYGSPYLRWHEPYRIMGHGVLGPVPDLTITYTVDLPANHREAIIADVAGYFAATQRGTGSAGPRLPGEGYVDAYDAPGTPLTLFPRIRALASQFPSIA